MTATKTFFKILKVTILLYGLGVSGVSALVGYDAAQLTFPPIFIPLPQFRTVDPINGTTEMMFFMGYGGVAYEFVVPTIIVVHDGEFGNNMSFTYPKLFGIDFGFPFPLIFPPGSMIFFNVTLPNYENPMFQFIVLPQARIGGFKIMEFQINTFTFPTIPIYNTSVPLNETLSMGSRLVI
ncbi:MAG: hypothetical protein HWN67_04195 [Candidatus Helarchaeota archaeon]|nr:hypothetical protein [Candidatus Helarchaeota archaeon]